MKAIVSVGLRPGVLDVQGNAVAHALGDLGFSDVVGARVGKIIELDLAHQDPERARREVAAMCEKLLANPVIESYSIAIEP